jgi:UDP-N-acetylglucosamine:LPS N-acetylglucosamine transferase
MVAGPEEPKFALACLNEMQRVPAAQTGYRILLKTKPPLFFITGVLQMMTGKRPKLLAISSGGGHWVQLLRLRPAFEGCDVHYATVRDGYRMEVEGEAFHLIPDSNRWNKLALLRSAVSIFVLILKLRPDVVISTGAAPGYFGIRFGKLLGARTIWVDSVANVEELSMSGVKAGAIVDLWLTQWPHLTAEGGPQCFGNVL